MHIAIYLTLGSDCHTVPNLERFQISNHSWNCIRFFPPARFPRNWSRNVCSFHCLSELFQESRLMTTFSENPFNYDLNDLGGFIYGVL